MLNLAGVTRTSLGAPSLCVLAATYLLLNGCGEGDIGNNGGGSPSTAAEGGADGSSSSRGGGGDAGAGLGGADGGNGGAQGGGGGSGGGGRDFSTDRSKFFGASRCDKANVLLCEDFESGSLDTNTWQVVGTKPVIDGGQHARGSKALHITQPKNGASYIKETKTFPVANNAYWGRMFVYFKSLPMMPDMPYAHWTFAAASGTGVNGEIRLSGQLSGGRNLFGVGTDSGPDDGIGTGDWTNSDNDPMNTPKAVPTGQWLCIEWLHDGQNNITQFYWDATEHKSLATTATSHGGKFPDRPYVMPQFTNVWMGWQEYQDSNETFESWIDELAIDTARIGCVI